MRSLKLLSVILAGFWIVACVTTSSTRSTKPQQPTSQQPQTESSQTRQAPDQSPSSQSSAQEAAQDKQKPSSEQSPSSPSASQETSSDEQEQAAEMTSSGQAASQEPSRDQPQQAAEKTQSGQTAAEQAAKDQPQPASENSQSGQTASREASAGAAGTQSKISEKRAGSTRPAAGSADSKLEEARRNLQISEATEKRIAAELEQLKKSGTASAETIKNYETYHESVKEMVAENRKIVEQMEAAKARYSSAASSSESGGGKPGDVLDPQIPEEQTTDRVAALDRELNASLSQFDAKLLKEMDAIRDESAEKMRDLAQEAAEAAKRLRDSGVAVNTTGSESSESSEETTAEGQTEKQSEKGDASAETASTDSSRPGGEGGGGAQQEQGRYEDDDIVARQLREAAENETDPELKEKLWKEYYEYKKNQRVE
ncbi:MAG: hypothetical protein JRH12_12470 [Deltaproteobacteria bacterium]|nr:hypothetical protein [Deltaproteobacteria bacterium]